MPNTVTEKKNRVDTKPEFPSQENITPRHNYYALMEYQTSRNLLNHDNNTILFNTTNKYFTNGKQALSAFLSSLCQYKQLATGETPEELKQNMIKLSKEYKQTI